MTKVLHISHHLATVWYNAKIIMRDDIQQAVKVLKSGGIVIFPTDTAYGIGCRIDDEEAVRRLFKLRRRSETKATPVLVSGLEMAQKYLEPVPQEVKEKLMNKFWPGALTIVLQSRIEKVSSLVRGGGNTLGLRMPDNQSLLKIIEEVGVPIIGTSANFAGEKTPYKFEDLDPELIKLVDYTLGDSGPHFAQTSSRLRPASKAQRGKQVSTVIDGTVKPWKILRQGAVELRNER